MILYKYCPPARFDVLVKGQVRFTPPGAFNDPFEFRPVVSQIADDSYLRDYIDREFDRTVDAELKKLGPLIHAVPIEYLAELRAKARSQIQPAFRAFEAALIPRLKHEFEDRFNRYFGVLCLSENWDSILMWGHYAHSHEGFAIGFNSEHPFFNQRRSEKDEFGFLRRVRYEKKRPVVSLANSDGLEWFETKADVWRYESEWRMFLVLSGASQVIQTNETQIHLFDFPPDSVEEVLLGYRCSEKTERHIRDALAKRDSTPKLYRCDIDATDYRVTRAALV